MRLSDFILLNESDKKTTVLHQGVLIAKRSDSHGLVFLFQLENYYVEAFCNAEHKTIEQYRIFHSVDLLSPYLESIAIDSLLN